jgi:hypothetical protein
MDDGKEIFKPAARWCCLRVTDNLPWVDIHPIRNQFAIVLARWAPTMLTDESWCCKGVLWVMTKNRMDWFCRLWSLIIITTDGDSHYFWHFHSSITEQNWCLPSSEAVLIYHWPIGSRTNFPQIDPRQPEVPQDHQGSTSVTLKPLWYIIPDLWRLIW